MSETLFLVRPAFRELYADPPVSAWRCEFLAFPTAAAAAARRDELEREATVAYREVCPFGWVAGVGPEGGSYPRWGDITSLEPGVWADYLRERGVEPPATMPASSDVRLTPEAGLGDLEQWLAAAQSTWGDAQFEAFWQAADRFRFFEIVPVPLDPAEDEAWASRRLSM